MDISGDEVQDYYEKEADKHKKYIMFSLVVFVITMILWAAYLGPLCIVPMLLILFILVTHIIPTAYNIMDKDNGYDPIVIDVGFVLPVGIFMMMILTVFKLTQNKRGNRR